ncbi:bifunctional adenosylcobinamide kinase/adenosylcobinamide-phosphate guanylyltransferase [Rhodococcoides corynebacterioides]|uniref:bifunctional adenosylcobinamide kinase/adenosylcobinamide-phosphate guanylyltransferase n=1 Tax=Rhodococcoides corynebacterioides TaxID=53972 RepID=UPI0009EE5A7D|nr:bifunctional adenosylcobinamide kinase/adenosylcobinamide-phosphate guanylyltransferase [Rhodococcus corynebacterioides]
MPRTLVLGGARSGKSGRAEALVADEPSVRYVATGRRDARDAEWADRIERHRDRRPAHWTTVEIGHHRDLVTTLRTGGVTLVDDLGTWLAGAFDDLNAWEAPRGTVTAAADDLVAAVADRSDTLVMVTPEVGMSVVPESRAGRLFRDEIGALNARLAELCDRVELVVAGRSLVLPHPDHGRSPR